MLGKMFLCQMNPFYPRHVQVKNIRHNGNITMEDIYNAARVIRPKSLAQDFSGIFPKSTSKYPKVPQSTQKYLNGGHLERCSNH